MSVRSMGAALLVGVLLVCGAARAETWVGRVDAVYAGENRLLVDDRLFEVGRKTRLLGRNGNPIGFINVHPGAYVWIETAEQGGGSVGVVQRLQVIGKAKAEALEREQGDP